MPKKKKKFKIVKKITFPTLNSMISNSWPSSQLPSKIIEEQKEKISKLLKDVKKNPNRKMDNKEILELMLKTNEILRIEWWSLEEQNRILDVFLSQINYLPRK